MPRATNSVALLMAVALAACRTAAPPQIARVPDPLAPPIGGGPLMVVQADAVRAAVGAAETGDFATAEKRLLDVPTGHPVRALASLEVRFLRGEKVAGQALELARSVPGYGSAWGFAVVAARREGDERGALVAARRAAELQPNGGWGKVVADLEGILTASLLGEGNALLKGGDPSGALARAREALAVNPDAATARILAVRALLALNETRAAAELVPGLPDTPDGLELKGSVAEALGQWDLAVEFYSRMPADHPRRCQELAAARRQLRLTNAPPYISEALASRPLLRRGLAAIVVWESPTLAAKASGPVPVFEDVVQLQEARDVVTVARAGVMAGDSIAHRFNPEGRVSPDELEGTLARLARVLGKPLPRWCSDGEDGCVRLPEIADGESAMALVRRVSGGGGDPCAQR